MCGILRDSTSISKKQTLQKSLLSNLCGVQIHFFCLLTRIIAVRKYPYIIASLNVLSFSLCPRRTGITFLKESNQRTLLTLYSCYSAVSCSLCNSSSNRLTHSLIKSRRKNIITLQFIIGNK